MSKPVPACARAQLGIDYEEIGKLRKMACLHPGLLPAPAPTYRFCPRCGTYVCANCDNDIERNDGALCDKCFDGTITPEPPSCAGKDEGHTFAWEDADKKWYCDDCGAEPETHKEL